MNEYSLNYDIAVIGGGPAGLATAITAAREGKKVVILEKNGFLGGNMTLGLPLLGFLDENGNQCISGFADEFVNRLKEDNASYSHHFCPKHNSVTNVDAELVKILAFKMCKEAGVDIVLHLEAESVTVENNCIKSVRMYGKGNSVTVSAKVFVDCTGDGDVAYLAGCSYEKGRDGSHEMMPPTVMCTIENVEVEKLLDYVEAHPDEMKPMSSTIDTKPGYDAAYFKADPNFVFVGMTQLFARLKKEGRCPVDRGNMIVINGLHKGQMYVNTTRLLNVDATDIISLTNAEIEGHLQLDALIKMFREEVPGFKNCYISSIAPNLGVRETRRFKGIRTIIGSEALDGVVPEDSICLSGYKIDIHNNTGNSTLFKTVNKPFGIPYGCLVSSELNNLLFAGRCISVDDQVIGSVRVMPCCMAMGQAAGLASVMAIDAEIKPADVNVPTLREKLNKQRAILSMGN